MKTKTTIRGSCVEIHVDDIVCFQCGLSFDSDVHKKTEHHAIPKVLRPKFNILIPICRKCHYGMNKIFAPKQLFYKNEMKMFINSFKKNQEKMVNKLNEIVEKLEVKKI